MAPNSSLFLDCSYQFTSNQLFPQTISLSKDQANGQAGSASDFSSSVMTAGVNCHSLSIAGMEVLDNNMEWKQVQKESHIVKSTQGYYYIRVSIDVHVFYSISDDIKNKFMWTQSQENTPRVILL